MKNLSKPGILNRISPDAVIRNEDNPRLYFRGEEMDSLMFSIKQYGIQVPISVYKDKGKFVLIDGERRWRCALKLNLPYIPALVQEKPSPLENLLLMYNIHALREQWDYFTIASKLPNVITLYKKENKSEPSEKKLSEATGLTRGQIRRCKFLLDLPDKYKAMLSTELGLPKQQQQLSEDLFIEMERALKTVSSRIPDTIQNINRVRDVLINKFRKGTIKSVTDFRKLSKIATSVTNLDVKEKVARDAIKQVFEADNDIGIDHVYSEHFELEYDEHKFTRNIEAIYDHLEKITASSDQYTFTAETKSLLRKLKRMIEKALEE